MNTIGNLWIYILSLLKKRPVYGYELQKVIFENFGFTPGKITSYRVLYRLAKVGFVKSKTKKMKRVYEITEKGRKELERARKFYKNLTEIIK